MKNAPKRSDYSISELIKLNLELNGAEDYIVKPFEVVELLARIVKAFFGSEQVFVYDAVNYEKTQKEATDFSEHAFLGMKNNIELMALANRNERSACRKKVKGVRWN